MLINQQVEQRPLPHHTFRGDRGADSGYYGPNVCHEMFPSMATSKTQMEADGGHLERVLSVAAAQDSDSLGTIHVSVSSPENIRRAVC